MSHILVHELTDDHVRQLHVLFQNEWWTEDRPLEEIQAMIRNTRFLFAKIDVKTGRLIAFARVLSDQVFKALIMDVVVHPDFRRQGLGRHLMSSIAEHEKLRGVKHFELYCLNDMVPYYEHLGFTTELGEVRFMRSTTFGGQS